MVKYAIPVWQMCVRALDQLGGRDGQLIPLIEIVRKVRELWPIENVNEGTIRDQVFKHCINCHPTHDEFPDRGKMWKQRKLFVTDGQGNYRFYDQKIDAIVYMSAVKQDESEGEGVPKVLANSEGYKKPISLMEIYEEVIEELQAIGTKLGFKTANGVRMEGGEIDHVWFTAFNTDLPYFGSKIPIIGFEIETSWRTRKHIKGDIFNLLTMTSAIGVILFLRRGFRTESQFKGNTDAAKRYVQSFAGGRKIFVWSEDDVNEIADRLF
jgi:hypothetical protein